MMRQQGRPGRAGKKGRDGKSGRAAQTRPSKAGKEGPPGRVSFCLYDENGLCESSGMPYRLVLLKKDASKLHPLPEVAEKRGSKRDSFAYGGFLNYGPALPVNIEAMSCPQSFLAGKLLIAHSSSSGSAPYEQKQLRPFPPMPPGTATRNGTLPADAAQKLRLQLPSLAESGFKLDGSQFPWADKWSSPAPRIRAKFLTFFEVGGLPLRPSDTDSGHSCGAEYDITVDIPVELELISGGDKAITAPLSIGLTGVPAGSGQAPPTPPSPPPRAQLAFNIRNNLFTGYEAGDCEYTLHLMCQRFSPLLEPSVGPTGTGEQQSNHKVKAAKVKEGGGGNSDASKESGDTVKGGSGTADSADAGSAGGKYSMEGPGAGEADYWHARYSAQVPSMEKGGAAEFKFDLQLPSIPPSQGTGAPPPPQQEGRPELLPGARLLSRVELRVGGALAVFSRPTPMRLAAPLPPSDPSAVLDTDVLVMAHGYMQIADYQAISQACAVLGLCTHFLDVEHYCSQAKGGEVDPSLWAAYREKKSIVVWAPPTPEVNACVSVESLQQHVMSGGGLVTGLKSTFQLPKGRNSFTQARRSVRLGNVLLGSLKKEAVVQPGTLVDGEALIGLLSRLVAALPVRHKLHLLMTESRLTQTAVGSLAATMYQDQLQAGCCGMGGDSKVVPLLSTPCTLFDLLAASLAADMAMDVEAYKTDADYQSCTALSAISAHVTKAIATSAGGSKAGLVGQCASALAAAGRAVGLQDARALASTMPSKVGRVWSKQSGLSIQLAIAQCESAASRAPPTQFPPALSGGVAVERMRDVRGLSERLRDLSVVKGYRLRAAGLPQVELAPSVLHMKT